MKVYFTPKENITNKYNEMIVNRLEKKLIICVENNRKNKIISIFDKNIKVFHFNWYETVGSKNRIKAFVCFVDKILYLLILKLFRKKIIWTLHNRVSHTENNKKLNYLMIKFMIAFSSNIIIHSKEESIKVLKYYNLKKLRKIFYLKHGNYINVYKKNNENMKGKLRIKQNEKVLLFLGAVKPYKNIEILIESFNSLKSKEIKLLIAGKNNDINYEAEISKKISNNKNIIRINEFVEDDDVEKYFKTSDALVTPYNIRSSLNSGSIYLGMSMKNLIVAPKIGTVKDLPEELIYSYEYKDKEEHVRKLTEQLKKLSLDMLNEGEFNMKKEKAYQLMKKEYDWDDIVEKLIKVYKEKQ